MGACVSNKQHLPPFQPAMTCINVQQAVSGRRNEYIWEDKQHFCHFIPVAPRALIALLLLNPSHGRLTPKRRH